jgi:hypothetical protein
VREELGTARDVDGEGPGWVGYQAAYSIATQWETTEKPNGRDREKIRFPESRGSGNIRSGYTAIPLVSIILDGPKR